MVEARTDTPAMLEALQAIAAFYGQKEGGNTAEARKSLRQDLEKQNMVLCDRFLGLFDVLRHRLDALDKHTASLEGHCQGIHIRIEDAEESMSTFVARTRALQKQQADAETKAAQITAFLEKFILSDAEVAALRYEPVDKVEAGGHRPFFAALARVQEIRAGCGALVGSPQQNAGFEMLEALSEHQEAAFRRLHSWILQRCAGLERDDAGGDVEENDVALGLGLRTMRGRPALFVHCQECLLQRRKDVVRRRFLLALTQGGGGGGGLVTSGSMSVSRSGGGGQRPIEMQAHDPVRYLSDILAWLHQTIASEREFLFNVLGNGEKTESEDADGNSTPRPADSAAAAAAEEEETSGTDAKKELSLVQMLAGIMEGVAPLLKARILQLLDPGNNNGLVLSFRLLNLLAFYDVTMAKLGLGPGASALGQALAETRAQGQRLFEAGLRHVGEQALASPPAYPMDLSAAALTAEAGRQLAEILAVHEAALIPAESMGYALDDVLTALVEPILRACRLGAEGLDPSDAAVYMLNNTAALLSSLATCPGAAAAAAWAAKLGEEIETWLDLLVRSQSEVVLERSGLGPLVERAQAVAASSSGTLSATAGLDSVTVGQTLKGFYQGLFALPQFERLQDPRMRARARQRTSALIAQEHEKAHVLFSKPEHGYPDHQTFLVHTPEQVKILLDCDEEVAGK